MDFPVMKKIIFTYTYMNGLILELVLISKWSMSIHVVMDVCKIFFYDLI